MNYLKALWKEEDAMGVVEVVLIIIVLVGLALIFKKQISEIADSLLRKVKNELKKF